MAFPVAVQSAIFYFMACTPCMSARNRYRAKKKFDKERKERAALEEDEPPLYRHPSPFNVNPYWQEEIMMGPSLPKKGRGNKNPSQRKLTSAGKESSVATRSSLAISSHGGPNNGVSEDRGGTATTSEAGVGNATGANTAGGAGATGGVGGTAAGGLPPPASPTLVPDDARSVSMVEASATITSSSIEGWNHKRYQREDEELWGHEPSRTHKLMDAIVKAGSSAGRLLESTLGKERERNVTDEDRAKFYAPTIIHPPVNEYHPPVVSSKPAHKDALRWMLQPPPPAKVMEGKVPVSRSASVASSVNGTGAGRKSAAAGSDVSLTRRMALEARLRRVDSTASGVANSGRARASSTEEVGGAVGPARSVSRKSATAGEFRPKSQQRASFQGRARSRSGSLASSAEDPGWSSDEDGLLKAKWRFPKSALAAGGSLSAGDSLAGPGLLDINTNNERSAATGSRATPASMQAPSRKRAKLETILSSDASGKGDFGSIRDEHKENTPMVVLDQTNVVVAAGSSNEDGPKSQHPRSAGSSMDSGLALSA